RLHGKLNGEIAPMTPMGRRRVNASLPSPACAASIGIISPTSFRASTAANVYVDIARDASTRAVLIGFPASSEIVRATSSCRRPIRPAVLTRISARLCAGSGDSSAFAAASTARRASSAPLRGAVPTTSPEYGERTSTASVVTMVRVYAGDPVPPRRDRQGLPRVRPYDRARGRSRARRHRHDRLDAGAG